MIGAGNGEIEQRPARVEGGRGRYAAFARKLLSIPRFADSVRRVFGDLVYVMLNRLLRQPAHTSAEQGDEWNHQRTRSKCGHCDCRAVTDNLKYPRLHLSSLEDNDIERYGGYEAITALYASPSPYRPESCNMAPLGYGQLWPEQQAESAISLAKDAQTLAQMLQPIYVSPDSPIADQLFGGQGRQLKLSLEHLVNLINERRHLHKRHIADINHTHMHMQERLFGAQLHGRLDGYRNALRMEQVLTQLDEQKRREELQCWKDTMEIREQMVEAAKEYGALRHRMSLLQGLEPGGIAYV